MKQKVEQTITIDDRKWFIKVITNSFELCDFQFQIEQLDHLLAKYQNETFTITESEMQTDMKWIDRLY